MSSNKTRGVGGHPTAERAAEIKGAVLAAVMTAFAEKGIDFGMDEVAAIAGVSKQAIYRRWRSKLDLVIEAVDSFFDEAFDQSLLPSADPVAALREFAFRVFGEDQVKANRVSLFLQVEGLRDERLRQRLMHWQARSTEIYLTYLTAIEAAGRRAEGDMRLQAELLIDLMHAASGRTALAADTSVEAQRTYFDQRWKTFETIAIRQLAGSTNEQGSRNTL